MCKFDGPWFGAGYPDAFCLGGYLHDADADGYDPEDTSNPRPRCNTRELLSDAKRESDGTAFVSVQAGPFYDEATGEQLWERAKAWARQENIDDADKLICEIEAVK